MLAPWKKSYDQPRQCIKKQRDHFANKGPSSQSYGFSSSHVWMWVGLYRPAYLKRPWCWQGLKAGGEGDDRGWDGWIAITGSVDMSLSKLLELVIDREAWRAAVHGITKSWKWVNDWTELMMYMVSSHSSSECSLKLKLKAWVTKTKTSYYFYWKVPMSKTSSPRKWVP